MKIHLAAAQQKIDRLEQMREVLTDAQRLVQLARETVLPKGQEG
ncbi:hypothetical protein MESS4_610025 [Mesorhizobium sp. STM 4661]|nr:hypothetical protein MESS4_610025 [Mesorhizobium sp. STM 4661]